MKQNYCDTCKKWLRTRTHKEIEKHNKTAAHLRNRRKMLGQS